MADDESTKKIRKDVRSSEIATPFRQLASSTDVSPLGKDGSSRKQNPTIQGKRAYGEAGNRYIGTTRDGVERAALST